MSELEFDRILDAVSAALEPVQLELFHNAAMFDAPLVPANDNGLAWPMIPFPSGWTASC